MKATISYKGLTVEIEGTPEEIAQYTEALSKQLSQPSDSTARATIIWQPPMWYEQSILYTIFQNGGANAINPYQQYFDIQVGGANVINPYQQFYLTDNCLPKWVSPLYSTMGSGLI